MQRRLLLAALCALVCAGVMSVSAQGTPPPAPEAAPPGYSPRGLGTTYLALGDSLTLGSEASLNNDNAPGYPDTLYSYLKPLSPALTYKNLGRDGETSTSMITATAGVTLTQLAAAETFIRAERAAGRRVGLVTLDIGGNDFINVLRNPFANPDAAAALYAKNLDIILDRLLEALKDGTGARDGDLVLMDYYNPYPGLKQQFPQIADPDTYVPLLNKTIKDAATARGLSVAEVYSAFKGREKELIYVQRQADGTYYPADDLLTNETTQARYDYHPRPAGHQQIAAAFLNVSGYKVRLWLPLVVQLPAPTATVTATVTASPN